MVKKKIVKKDYGDLYRTHILSVPIYNESQQRYYEKLNAKKEKIAYDMETSTRGMWTKEAFIEQQDNKGWEWHIPNFNWQHNEIIAFVEIYIEMNMFCFDLTYHTQKRIIFNSRRPFFRRSMQSGYHFNLGDFKTNKDISVEIKKWVESSVEDYTRKGKFVDWDNFNLLNDSLDYLNIIEIHTKTKK